jgi:hypothetical protein
MFRRDAYMAAGGYRAQFRFAQDLDLWVRMARLGRIVVVPEALYEATMEVSAISARNRTEQLEWARIALDLRHAADPEALLARAAAIGPQKRAASGRAEGDALYFIASCLRRRRDGRWRTYARGALRRNPAMLRAWLLFVRRPR